jgi:hypothetical protein
MNVIVKFALMLDGGSLLSEFEFDIRLSFNLWCSAVSIVPVVLVVVSG